MIKYHYTIIVVIDYTSVFYTTIKCHCYEVGHV